MKTKIIEKDIRDSKKRREERKKLPIEQRIMRVVKEYMERMFKLFETCKGVSTDSRIDCPDCGRHRGVEFRIGRGEWMCLWRDCYFTFPKELTPPSPDELRAWYHRQENEKIIKKFLEWQAK